MLSFILQAFSKLVCANVCPEGALSVSVETGPSSYYRGLHWVEKGWGSVGVEEGSPPILE